MALPENIRKNWESIQANHDHPVNAIGVKINNKDEKTLKVWRDEGIDKFIKK